MTFQRVSTLKNWVIGSIESDTGSEYLFGFDPEVGLMWLERSGVEYGPQDAVWGQAESYIRTSSAVAEPVIEIGTETVSSDPEEQYSVQMSSNGSERPRTVSRSMMGTAPDDYTSMPEPGDPRIVGDLSEGGRDFSEEDLAEQAAQFLANLGEE